MICPHNKSVIFTNKYGIKIYEHEEDNKPCNCLNSLIISTDEVINAYSSQFSDDELFEVSESIRKKAYYELSNCKEEKKAVKILKMIGAHNDVYPINEEIFFVFGNKIYATFNDYEINVKQLSFPNVSQEIQDKFAKLPLPNCLSKKINSIKDTMGKLKNKLNQMNKDKGKKYYSF